MVALPKRCLKGIFERTSVPFMRSHMHFENWERFVKETLSSLSKKERSKEERAGEKQGKEEQKEGRLQSDPKAELR